MTPVSSTPSSAGPVLLGLAEAHLVKARSLVVRPGHCRTAACRAAATPGPTSEVILALVRPRELRFPECAKTNAPWPKKCPQTAKADGCAESRPSGRSCRGRGRTRSARAPAGFRSSGITSSELHPDHAVGDQRPDPLELARVGAHDHQLRVDAPARPRPRGARRRSRSCARPERTVASSSRSSRRRRCRTRGPRRWRRWPRPAGCSR